MCATHNVKTIKVSKQLMEVRLSRRRAYETQRNKLNRERERETVLTRRPERGRAQGHNFPESSVSVYIVGITIEEPYQRGKKRQCRLHKDTEDSRVKQKLYNKENYIRDDIGD